MKKRGASQVDWAISLALFLLYIAWFFVFIRPSFEQTNDAGFLLYIVEKNFLDKVEWNVEKLPLIIYSNITRNNEPIIVDFPYSWDRNFSFLNKNYFIVDEGKLFFIDNLSTGLNYFWIVHSNSNYSLPNVFQDISADSTGFSIPDFKAQFSNSLIDKVVYKNVGRINSIDFFINNESINISQSYFNESPISAKYKVKTQALNISSYVFAQNSRIVSFVNLNPFPSRNYDLTLVADLYPFLNYYSNNLYTSAMNYSLNGCSKFSNNYIDFYDNQTGISFIFDKPVNISLCWTNATTLMVNLTLSLTNENRYSIFLHDNDENTLNYTNPYKFAFGMIETITGISGQKLNIINQTDYNTLKSSWGYPMNKDFSLIIYNDSETIFAYDIAKPSPNLNVYTKESDNLVVDKFADQKRYKLAIRGW